MKTNTFGFPEATHPQQAANQPVPTQGSNSLFEPLLSANEAAALLNISTTTLLRAARRGEAPHMKLGRRIAFRLSELNRWLTTGTYNGEAICVA